MELASVIDLWPRAFRDKTEIQFLTPNAWLLRNWGRSGLPGEETPLLHRRPFIKSCQHAQSTPKERPILSLFLPPSRLFSSLNLFSPLYLTSLMSSAQRNDYISSFFFLERRTFFQPTFQYPPYTSCPSICQVKQSKWEGKELRG